MISPITTQPIHDGIQKLYRFQNNYGASVVKHSYSYGGKDNLWELAVIQFTGPSWELCYTTSITNDVIGYLTPEAAEEILTKIQQLP